MIPQTTRAEVKASGCFTAFCRFSSARGKRFLSSTVIMAYMVRIVTRKFKEIFLISAGFASIAAFLLGDQDIQIDPAGSDVMIHHFLFSILLFCGRQHPTAKMHIILRRDYWLAGWFLPFHSFKVNKLFFPHKQQKNYGWRIFSISGMGALEISYILFAEAENSSSLNTLLLHHSAPP